MKHYYSQVDGVVLTHSDMIFADHSRKVLVNFERANANGFDFVQGSLPECTFQKTFGFSEDEIFALMSYLKDNAMLIWEFAEKGGGSNA
ncbi:MAG: hypothetical protein ACRC46_05325 [Thermoguttaceae bacterium]